MYFDADLTRSTSRQATLVRCINEGAFGTSFHQNSIRRGRLCLGRFVSVLAVQLTGVDVVHCTDHRCLPDADLFADGRTTL